MTTAGPDWLAGRSLLEHMARQGRPFTANDIRPQLRDMGFGRFDSGALFRAAKADGVLRRVGVQVSSDRPTHGAFVREWVGAGHRTQPEQTIPVRRDTEGRFTKPAPVADGPSLLDFMEPA